MAKMRLEGILENGREPQSASIPDCDLSNELASRRLLNYERDLGAVHAIAIRRGSSADDRYVVRP